jgi:hypothetical protein
VSVESLRRRFCGATDLARLTPSFVRDCGVTTLVAEVLPWNRAMISVFERGGYPVGIRSDPHGVEVEIDLAPIAPALARAA